MNRRRRASAYVVGAALVLGGVVTTPGVAYPLPDTAQPQLALNRLIRTSPFVDSTIKTRDNEGSAYVASDNALWVADDNTNALFEIDRTTGALRRQISITAFANALQIGGGTAAGSSRSQDLEAIAYDANAEVLYAFSGSTSAVPTVFRLVRDASNQFQVESWQPLATEYTAAGWRLADGLLYVANSSTILTMDYASNSLGSGFSISGLTKIAGIDFDDTSGDLIAVNRSQQLVRASMATRTMLPGWKVDLTSLGILDSRAVEVIGNQVFVSDGYDSRTSTDPMNHAIFVIDVGPRLVTVHWSAAEETRLGELVGFYGAANTDELVKTGVKFLAFLNGLDPQPNPTPAVLDPPGIDSTQAVTWNADELTHLDTVKARWVLNDEDAHRLGFMLLSYFAALSGQ